MISKYNKTTGHNFTFIVSDGQLSLLNESNDIIEPTHDKLTFDLPLESGEAPEILKTTNISMTTIQSNGACYEIIECGGRQWKREIPCTA